MWCRARVVGGHATIGRLSNNDFSTFQAIWNFFEKSRWTVTWQWSEVTRLSADCQTTFFVRFKWIGKILKKVAEWSRDSGWGHATVDRLSNNVFSTLQAIWENFQKSRWTVTRQWSEVTRPSVDGHTTIFRRFKTFFKKISNCLKRRKIVVWQSVDGRVTSDHCRVTVQRFFSNFFLIASNVQKTLFDSRPTVAWPPTTVAWPFSDFFQKIF